MEITNFELLSLDSLSDTIKRLNSVVGEKMIIVAGHCYGCTAGQGSSCGGALS